MSALTLFNGRGPVLEDYYLTVGGSVPAFSAGMLIDAATERTAMVVCVWHPTVKTGTINIRKVHFRCGAVTFNAASVLRVSLQTISATAGAPYQPDGTQDQTADMTTLTANGWNTTGALSADRAVDLGADSLGDTNSRLLCVVWEYQTFTAADSVVISSIGTVTSNPSPWTGLSGRCLNYNGTSWAAVSAALANIVLELDDGTFAFAYPFTPFSALSSASVSSTGAIRRAGLKFRVPIEIKIDAANLYLAIPNLCDGTVKIYDSDGSTELISIDIDNDAVLSTSAWQTGGAFAPITLAANTYYRLVFVGGTSTAATVYYGEVNAAGHMDGLVGGQDFHWTQHDGSVWTDTTTRRPHFGIGLSSVHDGAGGAAAVQYRPNMGMG